MERVTLRDLCRAIWHDEPSRKWILILLASSLMHFLQAVALDRLGDNPFRSQIYSCISFLLCMIVIWQSYQCEKILTKDRLATRWAGFLLFISGVYCSLSTLYCLVLQCICAFAAPFVLDRSIYSLSGIALRHVVFAEPYWLALTRALQGQLFVVGWLLLISRLTSRWNSEAFLMRVQDFFRHRHTAMRWARATISVLLGINVWLQMRPATNFDSILRGGAVLRQCFHYGYVQVPVPFRLQYAAIIVFILWVLLVHVAPAIFKRFWNDTSPLGEIQEESAETSEWESA